MILLWCGREVGLISDVIPLGCSNVDRFLFFTLYSNELIMREEITRIYVYVYTFKIFVPFYNR